MDMAILIVTFAAMAISGVAAVAAIVQARAAHASQVAAEDARNESRTARDEAARLSAEANDAFKRQAEAQEESNRLAKAAMPRRAPKIEIHQLSDSRWMASNAGNLPATAAQIVGISGIIRPDDDEARALHVGDALYFHAIKTFQSGDSRIRVQLEWIDDDGEEMTAESEITLP